MSIFSQHLSECLQIVFVFCSQVFLIFTVHWNVMHPSVVTFQKRVYQRLTLKLSLGLIIIPSLWKDGETYEKYTGIWSDRRKSREHVANEVSSISSRKGLENRNKYEWISWDILFYFALGVCLTYWCSVGHHGINDESLY